jgi:DNA primase
MSQGIEKWTLDKHVAGPMVLSEDVFKHFHPAWEHSVSRVYLSGRDVSPELCTEFGLLYDTRQERVVFPVRDRSGNLVGGVGRAITGREPRYFNYLNFPSGATLGGHDRLDNERPFLIVVEGFFDLLRCYRWAHDVESDIVCTWKSEVAEAQADLILQLDKSIQIWYDGDEAGREGWNKASRSLGPVALGLRRATLPEDKDPGELVEAEFLSVFRSTMGALR